MSRAGGAVSAPIADGARVSFAESRPRPRRFDVSTPEICIAVAALAAAIAAVVVTLRADFLAYPGWLAVQKADLILGPVGVGLYWRRQRPQSRFGPLLIAFGFLHVPYIAQSSSDPGLFTFGVHWEGVIYLATLALILGFPSGRLGLVDRAILSAGAVFAVLPSSAIVLFSPAIFAGGSISACRAACPDNALYIAGHQDAVPWLFDVARWAIVAIAFGAAVLLLWRFATGTPPRRRALAIGTPLALVFLLTQASYQVILALEGTELEVNTYVRWAFVVARSALWYGFLLALVVAQLFAGRVLRRVAGESLRRPSLDELATLLREPLGDPSLRLAFRQDDSWTDGEANLVEPPAAGSGTVLTEVDRDGRPAAAIIHDSELADDPELLQAAGATALLAFENAELQAAWTTALDELKDSRTRLATASARERRSLERDLHDGAQQRLFAIQLKVQAAREHAPDRALADELDEIAEDAATAVEELRSLAHGLYPTILQERGLVDAVRSVTRSAAIPVEVIAPDIGRLPVETEEAVYFCVREAIQNATKHGGLGTHVSVLLERGPSQLEVVVQDDGPGFDVAAASDGIGVVSMRDRIGAIGGEIEIMSTAGRGTSVRVLLPLE